MAKIRTMEAGAPLELKAKADADGQENLIETDNEEDKILIRLARDVRKLDKERSDIQDKAEQKRQKIIDAMHQRGLQTYRFGDVRLEIKPGTEKLSVKTAESNDGD